MDAIAGDRRLKILVLGARSFYGGWFCRVARDEGHDVVGLARPTWDLRGDGEDVAAAVRAGFAHVVNFAALNVVAPSWDAAPDYYEANVVGIARLAAAFRKVGSALARFVQVSTPEVYGTTGEFLKEGAPFNPTTPYAVSRAAGDWHLALEHRFFGLPVCFTRTVNVYGETQQAFRIIPRAIAACSGGERLRLEGGGVSTRSFIHVEDAARATLAVLLDGRSGETYHVAHPTQVAIRDLVEMICARFGKSVEDVADVVPERVAKDMAYQLDDSKIRAELGWVERVPLDYGLTRTIRWFNREEAVA